MLQGLQDWSRAKLDEAKTGIDTALAGKRLLDDGGDGAWVSIEAKAECVRAEAFHASLLADLDGLGANYEDLSCLLREVKQRSAASSLLGDADLSEVDSIKGFGPLADATSKTADAFAMAFIRLGVSAPTMEMTPSEDVAAGIVATWKQHHDNVVKPTAAVLQQGVDSTAATLQSGVDSALDAVSGSMGLQVSTPASRDNITMPVLPSGDNGDITECKLDEDTLTIAINRSESLHPSGVKQTSPVDALFDGLDLQSGSTELFIPCYANLAEVVQEGEEDTSVESKTDVIADLEASKRKAIANEDFDLANKFKSKIHDAQNQRRLLEKDEAAAKKKAEDAAAENLVAKIAELDTKKKEAIKVEDFDLAKTLKSELQDLQKQATEAAAAKTKAEEEAAEKAAEDARAAEETKAEEVAVEQAAQDALEAAREKAAQAARETEERRVEEAALEKAADDARDAKVTELEARKAEAIRAEDFDLAKSLKAEIQDLKNQATDEAATRKEAEKEAAEKVAQEALAMEIIELEAQKAKAIRSDDFDLAEKLSSEIQALRTKIIPEEAAAKAQDMEEAEADELVARWVAI